jgi:hypothetical protein
LAGRQEWSGADLHGAASNYGSGYARQRRHAQAALEEAGGELVFAGTGGRKVAAVQIGQTDFGDAIYETEIGIAVPRQHASMRLKVI